TRGADTGRLRALARCPFRRGARACRCDSRSARNPESTRVRIRGRDRLPPPRASADGNSSMSLRFEQDGRVRRITLAAASRRNVFDPALATEFLSELAHAASDPETGAILLDAEGPVFCAGAESLADLPKELFTFGQSVEKPVVVAVQGVALS